MSNTDSTDSDVIVVGAGPTGLMLAGDLAELGRIPTMEQGKTLAESVSEVIGAHSVMGNTTAALEDPAHHIPTTSSTPTTATSRGLVRLTK